MSRNGTSTSFPRLNRVQLLIFSILLLSAGYSGFAVGQADADAALRARIKSFWDAMVSGDYDAATQYVHPESRYIFTHRIPKSRYGGWKMGKLEFNKERTAGKSTIYVKKALPIMGAELDWPLYHDWSLFQNEWYLVIPEYMAGNPIAEMFRTERETSEQTRAMAAKPAADKPEKPEAKVTDNPGNMALGRFVPDSQNPTVVRFGQPAVFRYRYINEGRTPFRIASVHADCHCTSYKKDFPELKPGEEAVLEITLDSFGLPLGKLEKEVLVQFSDLPTSIRLGLAVENIPNFVLSPGELSLGTLRVGQEVEKRVRIRNESGQPVRFLPMPAADSRVSVSLERESMGPGEETACIIRFKVAEVGEMMGTITLWTDLKAEPLINLRLSGKVVP